MTEEALKAPTPKAEVGFLVSLVLLLPTIEAVALLKDSPPLLILVYATYAAFLLAFTVIPWLGSAWARRLAKELERADPLALVAIVVSRSIETDVTRLRVLVVSQTGVEFIDQAGARDVLPWNLISGLAVVQSGPFARESVSVDCSGVIRHRFVPMRRSAPFPLSSFGTARLVSSMSQLRAGVHPRPV